MTKQNMVVMLKRSHKDIRCIDIFPNNNKVLHSSIYKISKLSFFSKMAQFLVKHRDPYFSMTIIHKFTKRYYAIRTTT